MLVVVAMMAVWLWGDCGGNGVMVIVVNTMLMHTEVVLDRIIAVVLMLMICVVVIVVVVVEG